jgi:hypothetical protein
LLSRLKKFQAKGIEGIREIKKIQSTAAGLSYPQAPKHAFAPGVHDNIFKKQPP